MFSFLAKLFKPPSIPINNYTIEDEELILEKERWRERIARISEIEAEKKIAREHKVRV